MVTAKIPIAMLIHATDQNNAGIPVALAMLTASVGTGEQDGEEGKKTVFMSGSAFSTHWTARKLTRNVAARGRAYFATATNPTLRNVPARIEKGSAEEPTPDNAGLINP